MSISDYLSDEERKLLLNQEQTETKTETKTEKPASDVHTEETQEPSSFLPRSKRTRKNKS